MEFLWKSDFFWAHDNHPDHNRSYGPPTYGNELLRQARHHGWRTMDLYTVTKDWKEECYDDELHLNEVARTHLNELLLRELTHGGDSHGGGVAEEGGSGGGDRTAAVNHSCASMCL